MSNTCLGGQLARLDVRVLLQEALRRLPGLQMDKSTPFRHTPAPSTASRPRRFASIKSGPSELP